MFNSFFRTIKYEYVYLRFLARWKVKTPIIRFVKRNDKGQPDLKERIEKTVARLQRGLEEKYDAENNLPL